MNLIKVLIEEGDRRIKANLKKNIFLIEMHKNFKLYENGMDRGSEIRKITKIVLEILNGKKEETKIYQSEIPKPKVQENNIYQSEFINKKEFDNFGIEENLEKDEVYKSHMEFGDDFLNYDAKEEIKNDNNYDDFFKNTNNKKKEDDDFLNF